MANQRAARFQAQLPLLPNGAPNPEFPLIPSGPLFTGTGAQRRLVLPLSIGTLGRNTIRGPNEVQLDVSVSRRIPISEAVRFELRAEAFNALNRTNFQVPGTGLNATVNSSGQPFFNSQNFGLITSARDARRLQLVLRFEF